MSQEERTESMPEETGEPTPSPSLEGNPTESTETDEATAPVAPEKTAEEVQASESAPVYRWTYAGQAAYESASASAKHRKGILIYALIMTGVFLISFAMLVAVLAAGQGGYTGIGVTRPGILENDSEAVQGVEQAKHSVVVIETKTATGGGTGTGIIMTADGYIATNHHVIEGAEIIRVTFYDGRVMEAKLVGSSEMDDLGVIKVAATGLPAATFADSDYCYVGQTVYAIGTPAGPDFGWTTTKGIISYKNREVKMYAADGTLQKKLRLLQTDANVNPGNSGGPLINTAGEVVGVVSMKLSDGFEGIGFAIPSDGAVEILNAIVKYGNADSINSSLSHKRPMLGITGIYLLNNVYYLPTETGVQMVEEDELDQYDRSELIRTPVSGIYVMGFADGMDAATKMQIGDIITAAQGETIESMEHLIGIINEYYAGDTVTLTVYRGGRYIPVNIVLSAQSGS